MEGSVFNEFLESARIEFLRYKKLGADSIEVLDESELNRNPRDANSVVIIVQHLHGNMRSRWTNLFTEDGEKPDRNRDAEFESTHLSKQEVVRLYHAGWSFVEAALSGISWNDASRPVVIRNERLTVTQAINRQLTHYAYHIGQIVYIAKQCRGTEWKSLSMPKRRSAEHTQGKYLEQVDSPMGMKRTYRSGAVGALLDEYERAASELLAIIDSINDSEFELVRDPHTSDEHCRSVQTIMSHVVHSGFGYANSIRKACSMPEEDSTFRILSRSESTAGLVRMMKYTADTLNDKFGFTDDQMMAVKMVNAWGQTYDMEQRLEHAIVHILRHRRQVDRFLLREPRAFP